MSPAPDLPEIRRRLLAAAPDMVICRAVGLAMRQSHHAFAGNVITHAGVTYLPCIRCPPMPRGYLQAGPAVATLGDELVVFCFACHARYPRSAIERWIEDDLDRWDHFRCALEDALAG